MTQFDDEVDPFEPVDKTPSAYVEEDVDDFTIAGDSEELDDDSVDADDDDSDDDDDLDEEDDSDDDDEDDDDDDEEDGDDEDDDDDEDGDEDDDLDDALEAEIDLVVAIYREDGQPVAVPLALDLANDLDELIDQLRRIPGDGGAIGMVSIAGEFFVVVRVRGRNVQVLLNDSVAANDWPIARDVADYLGEDIPDPEDDSDVMGDLSVLADVGISEFDMESIAEDLDEDSDELLRRLVKRLKFTAQFDKAVAAQKH